MYVKRMHDLPSGVVLGVLSALLRNLESGGPNHTINQPRQDRIHLGGEDQTELLVEVVSMGSGFNTGFYQLA